MKQEIKGTGAKIASFEEKSLLHVYDIRETSSSSASPFPCFVPVFAPVSFPAPHYLFISQGFQLDLNIYREPMIKALVKEHSEDIYRLIKKVHFDGNYYSVKSVRYGEWEYCLELAVQAQFFGELQGLAFKPQRIFSRKNKKIIYRSLILINPHELWDKELAGRLWNIQERIEFLIAKILFHECIHVFVFMGKTLSPVFRQTDIYLEFRQVLEFANSGKLCPESYGVKSHLQNLSALSCSSAYFPERSGEKSDMASELYEFLLHEKYSIKKTDQAFGFSWSNSKISRNYARMAALKLSPFQDSNKKDWKKEVFRLSKDLKKLYDRIDDNYRPFYN